ncbi:MAG: hypothetical protein JXA37_06480 [Chloroflexia bacterium]|nr:hypothetical protein [Chloroflexia bacterium]
MKYSTRLARLFMLIAILAGPAAACNGQAVPANTPPPASNSRPPTGGTLPTAAPAPTGAALCGDPQPPPVEDLQVYHTPALDEPPARRPFRDPVFGSCMVRVSDRQQDLGPEDDSPGLANEYARVQSFNADESLLLLYGVEGSWYLYDADTLRPLREVPHYLQEPRWDARDPERLYVTDETRLLAYNVRTDQQTLVHDFAPDLPGQELSAVWTRYEGRPSADGRYWALMAEDGDWTPVAFLVYDLQSDEVALRDVRGLPGIEDDVDHVAMSPLGSYFLASFDRACEQGHLGDDAHPCGLMVYDRDLRSGRGLLRIVGHYDTALDAQSREVVIYQDIDTDYISLLDLQSGSVTPLWPIDFSHTGIGLHFSGCAFARPGWALVSTHDDDPGDYTWMDDQVFAVELEAGGRVIRLAHTHSLVDDEEELDYWAEPRATVNRDFSRALFTTNWGRSGTGEVEVYMIQVPAGVLVGD